MAAANSSIVSILRARFSTKKGDRDRRKDADGREKNFRPHKREGTDSPNCYMEYHGRDGITFTPTKHNSSRNQAISTTDTKAKIWEINVRGLIENEPGSGSIVSIDTNGSEKAPYPPPFVFELNKTYIE